MFNSLSPLNITTLILTLGVIFVNGLTDAPNSVATCITTRCLKLKTAVIFSAVFNFLGVFLMSKFSAEVTETVLNMASFSNTEKGEIALCAALFSIVLWAIAAWYFGIPTSESHALIAGLLGSSLALNGSLYGVNFNEWAKTIYGLFVSCFGGFIVGFLICRIVLIIFRNVKRSKAEKFFTVSQIFASFLMSFMHGAQDGQKFLAVMLMSLSSLENGENIRTPLLIICSLTMALGTVSGGKKIIKAVGMDMVKLEKYQGFSADISASTALFVSTVFGLPVSTTHAKTTAMMGAGFAKNKKSLNTNVIRDIGMTWILTFPGCGLLGFVATKIFLRIFS